MNDKNVWAENILLKHNNLTQFPKVETFKDFIYLKEVGLSDNPLDCHSYEDTSIKLTFHACRYGKSILRSMNYRGNAESAY